MDDNYQDASNGKMFSSADLISSDDDNINSQRATDEITINSNKYWSSFEKTGHTYASRPPLQDDAEIYCICRSTDTDRFMIGCDRCNEWYHGDCINISEEYAKTIRKFYCLRCMEKDPLLVVKFKQKKEKKEKEKSLSRTKTEKIKKRNRRCGECIACYRREDCGRCDFCKDMKKFGGLNKLRQKCRQRQCMNFGVHFGHSSTQIHDSDEYDSNKEDPSYIPEKKLKKQKSPKRSASSREHSTGSEETRRKLKTKRTYSKHRDKIDEQYLENVSNFVDEESSIRQCYGPGCVNVARVGSKYCCDDCGIKLATNRLYEILPHRLQHWQTTPCVNEENNKKELDKIRKQQFEAREALTQLDKRNQELDALIERGKNETIDHNLAHQESEGEETELIVYCITCGHEVSARIALRHFEKCFNKYESQTSFGSVFKTRIEGQSMFCDFYNPLQGTYCKRLRVLCPEHLREPKVLDNEICGFPIQKNLFELTGEFCRMSKKKCAKHHCWEKLRRAEIEMERVREWLRIDELFEQERNVRVALANRAGVLGLMLHQTVDHDALQKQQAALNQSNEDIKNQAPHVVPTVDSNPTSMS